MMAEDPYNESGHALRSEVTSRLQHLFENDPSLEVSMSHSSWFDNAQEITKRSDLILERLHAVGSAPQIVPSGVPPRETVQRNSGAGSTSRRYHVNAEVLNPLGDLPYNE